MIKLIECFEEYKKLYDKLEEKTTESIIKLWEDDYLNDYPDIKEMCIHDYDEFKEGWKYYYTEHAVDSIINRWNEYEITHNNMMKNYAKVVEAVNKNFPIEDDIYFIFYFGLCNGAGHVDKYRGKHAVYFGYEQIVNLNWYSEEILFRLISHELGHIYHFIQREKAGLDIIEPEDKSEGAIWRLYEEGFAERFEQKVRGSDVYTNTFGEGTIEWCLDNIDKIKNEYIATIKKGEEVYKFYGDWHSIEGHTRTGYFLGPQLIKFIEREMEFKDIALLKTEEYRKYAMEFLKSKSML